MAHSSSECVQRSAYFVRERQNQGLGQPGWCGGLVKVTVAPFITRASSCLHTSSLRHRHVDAHVTHR